MKTLTEKKYVEPKKKAEVSMIGAGVIGIGGVLMAGLTAMVNVWMNSYEVQYSEPEETEANEEAD